MPRFYEQLAAALEENRPFALAVISGTKGSSPQRLGAKALFFADGKIFGTLGGGCLEAEVHARARKALKTGQPATFEMVLDHDFGWDDGLICGGSVSGLILPRAAEAAELWRKRAERRVALPGDGGPAAGFVDCRFRSRGSGRGAAGAETGFCGDGFRRSPGAGESPFFPAGDP